MGTYVVCYNEFCGKSAGQMHKESGRYIELYGTHRTKDSPRSARVGLALRRAAKFPCDQKKVALCGYC